MLAGPEWMEGDVAGLVKENRPVRAPLAAGWLWAGAAATLGVLLVAAVRDEVLPPPLMRDAPEHLFSAERASDYLHNLTKVGPRVSGSSGARAAAAWLARALQAAGARAAPHVRLDVHVHAASGGFPLRFFDGMNNIYRDVQSVVARLSAPAALPRRARPALLLNCHYDTVPDSPGASDDGAGCAVALEVARALAAAPGALTHDVVFLFNGAEENIMQGSHAFLTTHEWASSIRTFINIEACGAGGRELLFQAGPHDPWLMEVYGSVPHPFASSLAQEIFESGLVPGDTDFRIFRDVGNLSGVDLAWNANGYVYHTALDTAERVPLGSLQRTGENVLALVHGLLSSSRLDSVADRTARQPVYFDVLGLTFVSVRAPLALVLALAAVALVLLRVQRNARRAHAVMHMRVREYWWLLLHVLSRLALAALCGVASVLPPALALHAAGARTAWYREPRLLLPMYALPSLCVSWLVITRSLRLPRAPGASWWARWALGADAAALGWAGALAAGAACARRASYLPWLWAAGAALPALLLPNTARWAAAAWCSGCLLPALQTSSLAISFLQTFVPVMGRAGDRLPPDMVIAVVVSLTTLCVASWLTPLLLSVRRPHVLIWSVLCVCCATHVLVLLTPLGAAHSAARPQRYMMLHTRRTIHPHPSRSHAGAARATEESGYWVPTLHASDPHAVDEYVAEMRSARATTAEECSRYPHCGAPYPLPVLSLVPTGLWLPAPAPPRARLRWSARSEEVNTTTYRIHLHMAGSAHMVAIVSPARGASVVRSSLLAAPPLEGARWRGRRTYMFTLHHAGAGAGAGEALWDFTLDIQHSLTSPPDEWAALSLAAHCMFGANQTAPAAAATRAAFPDTAALTGWGVDLHLAVV